MQEEVDNASESEISGGKRSFCLLLGSIIGLCLLFFHKIIPPGVCLLSTDNNVGATALAQSGLPQSIFGWWIDGTLIGIDGNMILTWLTPLLTWLPASVYTSWIYSVYLGVGSLFFVLYLRERGCSWQAAAGGVLTALWVGSNFTLIYAGHMGKFSVLMFSCLYLWLVERAVRTGRWSYAILSGGAMGSMFLEQPDLALFFAVVLGLYAIYAIWRDHGLDVGRYVRILIPIVSIAILIAFHALGAGYRTSIEGVATMQEDDPKAKWEFATQWSWPPEESIDFIAPGFMGWRSGEADGPYWGRMGRSAGWKESGQGFANFKLENQYIGGIAMLMAAWAFFLAWKRRREGGPLRDVLFWSGVTAVALLLSFGKFFPLYKALYSLPVISSIRNPNKFLQVFQLALGIVAAYGIEFSLGKRSEQVRSWLPRPSITRFVGCSAMVAVLLFAWWFLSVQSLPAQIGSIASEGWGTAADLIVNNKNSALFHGAVVVLIGVAVLALSLLMSHTDERFRAKLAWVTVAVLLIDALMLSVHYVKPFSMKNVERNPLAELLLSNGDHHRTSLVSQDSFYNHFLTYLFPYHQIPALNVTQMPRMPEDYKAFMNTMGRQPLKLWQFAAVRHILGPSALWSQLQADPATKERFELVFAYNVSTDPDGALIVHPATQEQPGQHIVARYKRTNDRFTLIGDWEFVADEQALARMAAPEYEPFRKAMIAPEFSDVLPESAGHDIEGTIQVLSYRSGQMRFKIAVDYPAIFRMADRYTREWKATVNGKPHPLLRCDFICQGIYLEPGVHDVIVKFAPPISTLWVQIAGMAICVIAAVHLGVTRKKPSEPPA